MHMIIGLIVCLLCALPCHADTRDVLPGNCVFVARFTTYYTFYSGQCFSDHASRVRWTHAEQAKGGEFIAHYCSYAELKQDYYETLYSGGPVWFRVAKQ